MPTSFSQLTMCYLRRGLAAAAFAAATCAFPGCSVTPSATWFGNHKPVVAPPSGQAREMLTMWDREVALAPDPTRNYQMSPCLVGRMTLLGPNQWEVCPDGIATVSLWDERPAQGGPPVLVEQWNIDKENLRKLIGRNALGWGYTLALPTEGCKPHMSHIRLDVVFQPENSPHPIYATSGVMRLSFDELLRRQGITMAGWQPPQPTAMPPGQPGIQPGFGPAMPQQMMIPPQAQQQAPSPQYQQQPVSQLVFPPQNQALSQQHPNGAQMNNQHAAPQGQYQQYPMPPQQQQQQVLAPLQQQPMQLYNQNQTIVPPQAPRPPMPVPPQGIQFPGGQSQAQAGMPAAPNPLPLVAPPAGAQQAAPAMPHLQFQPNGQ